MELVWVLLDALLTPRIVMHMCLQNNKIKLGMIKSLYGGDYTMQCQLAYGVAMTRKTVGDWYKGGTGPPGPLYLLTQLQSPHLLLALLT